MSKVKIQGNASGTGVLTLEAPNTNTDRTITLPDSTGTVLMTDGDGSGLSNVGVDGIVSSADATAITITSSEKVGVLDTSPQAELSISPAGTNAAAHTTGIQVRHNGYSGYKSGMSAGDTATTTYNCGFIGFIGGGHTGAGKREIIFETRPGTTDAAPTERLRITHDGRGLSQFTAGAWVNFKTDAGTPTLNDSHNVSSIGDWGTGQFGIYIASGFSNGNYCPVGMGNDRRYMSINQDNTAPQGGRLDVYCTHANGTDYDMPTNNVVIFGDM